MKIIPTIYIVYLENVNFPIKCTIIGHYTGKMFGNTVAL